MDAGARQAVGARRAARQVAGARPAAAETKCSPASNPLTILPERGSASTHMQPSWSAGEGGPTKGGGAGLSGGTCHRQGAVAQQGLRARRRRAGPTAWDARGWLAGQGTAGVRCRPPGCACTGRRWERCAPPSAHRCRQSRRQRWCGTAGGCGQPCRPCTCAGRGRGWRARVGLERDGPGTCCTRGAARPTLPAMSHAGAVPRCAGPGGPRRSRGGRLTSPAPRG